MPKGRMRKVLEAQGFKMDGPITCPAGSAFESVMEGPSCFCRIEGSPVTAVSQPSTLVQFCKGNYKRCSTWRAAREAEWERKRLLDEERVERVGTIFDEDPERRPEFVVSKHPGAR